MKRWNSVVGKLWATILLLMFVVLFVLSILIMQFFQSYVVEDVKKSLIDTASQIAKTLEEHDEFSFALEVAWEILDENTHAIIITDENHIYHSNPEDKKIFDINYFKSDKTLSQVFTIDDSVTKEIEFTQSDEKLNQGLMIGVPIHLVNKTGAVFIYQSLDVMDNAIEATSDIILWSAGIAFILTSAFAFFLSTRVTAPLRKMRESAAEVAKGRFDVKVPILTHDEIGELAKTFNKMREQLEVNMNALKREKEQLSSILRSMADGVITINKQGEILVTNPPADEFLSAWTDSQDNKGKKEIPPEFIDLLNESIKTGKDQSGEMNFGDRYWSFYRFPAIR